MSTDSGKVTKFFQESQDRFTKKRQASKYLNGFGSVYKTQHNIPMEYSTRTFLEVKPTPKSAKNLVKKKGK